MSHSEAVKLYDFSGQLLNPVRQTQVWQGGAKMHETQKFMARWQDGP